MHHVETYAFVEYHYTDGQVRYRTELPIRVLNPYTGATVDTLALLDTGADACLFNRATAEMLGHDLAGDGVVGSVTGGVGGQAVTYKHTINLQLLSGSADCVAWESGPELYDCIDAEIPILLGVGGFLGAFKVTVDYPGKTVRLEWSP